jgi:hypothetical protein
MPCVGEILVCVVSKMISEGVLSCVSVAVRSSVAMRECCPAFKCYRAIVLSCMSAVLRSNVAVRSSVAMRECCSAFECCRA